MNLAVGSVASVSPDAPILGWHPAVDEFGDEFVIFATSDLTVLLTEPFAAFLAEAAARGGRPVLMTALGARVSPFVSLSMRQAGGVWAAQAPDGSTFDAMSGYRIETVDELWAPVDVTRERLPAFSQPVAAESSVQVLSFDVYSFQLPDEKVEVGRVAELIAEVMGSKLECWGTREPLLEPWDAAVVTRAARAGMPESQTLRGIGTKGFFSQSKIVRTPKGLLEHTIAGISFPKDEGGLAFGDVAASVLKHIAQRHNSTVAFASTVEYDLLGAVVVQSARARMLESPVAVLIGPRGVRDLGVDIDGLARDHNVLRLGRAKTPSLLIQFAGTDRSLWGQAAQFAAALGGDAIKGAAGLLRAEGGR